MPYYNLLYYGETSERRPKFYDNLENLHREIGDNNMANKINKLTNDIRRGLDEVFELTNLYYVSYFESFL